jgi:hypothetical protein
MGHAAEYISARTGRQITRDEAFEIIRRAEENGLMHQIPNTDGPGNARDLQLLRLWLPLAPYRRDVPQYRYGPLELRIKGR